MWYSIKIYYYMSIFNAFRNEVNWNIVTFKNIHSKICFLVNYYYKIIILKKYLCFTGRNSYLEEVKLLLSG